MNANFTLADMTGVANTTDHLEFHAMQTPDKLAFRWQDVRASYGTLYADVIRVTHALRKKGLMPEQLALVYIRHTYLHLVILLACENLRVATASIQNLDGTILFDKADMVLSDTLESKVPIPLHLLDSSWYEIVRVVPLHEAQSVLRLRAKATDTVRVTRSSGTTGTPKLIRVARFQFENFVTSLIHNNGYSTNAVFLTEYGLEVYSIWGQVSVCMRMGATALLGEAMSRLVEHEVTHLWLLPRKISEMLRQIPGHWKKPSNARLFTGGAPVSDILKAKALESLCSDVVNRYATNEIGSLCSLGYDNSGVLMPGVEMRVVDDAGQDVSPGQEGHLAFRSPAMIQAYWDQPEYTAQSFRDGWFYPGDRGRLVGFRRMQLLGRDDDMLNIGGIKQPAGFIEQVVARIADVQEAAATTATASDGVDVLVIAVVLADPQALARVRQTIMKLIPSLARTLHVVACKSLPRTPNGKVMRRAIRDAVQSGRSRP